MKVFNSGSPTNPANFDANHDYTCEAWLGLGPREVVLSQHPVARTPVAVGHVRRAIVLVHGFNSTKARVEAVYSRLAQKFYELPDAKPHTEIVGFRWPSDGSPFRYFADLADAKLAGLRLAKLALELRQEWGAAEVHVVAHSMGAEVAMSALKAEVGIPITTITLVSADLCAADMRTGKRWGAISWKVRSLHAYYSASDDVLNFWARLAWGRGFKRLGTAGMPDPKPANYHNWNAEGIAQCEVRHNTYAESDRLIASIAHGWDMP